MNVSYLGFVRRGDNVPTLTTILLLAETLGVNAGDLVSPSRPAPVTGSCGMAHSHAAIRATVSRVSTRRWFKERG